MGGVRRRFWLRKSWRRGRRGEGHVFLFLAAAAGIGLALFVIGRIEAEVRPLAELLAEANVKNAVTALVNQAVEETLAAEAVAYDDLVTLKTDSGGYITAMTTNSVKLNTLRTEILGAILEQVNSLDSAELSVPIGSLTGLSWANDRGPGIPVQVLSAAVPEVSFRNVFTSAGINQTLHQVMLEVSVQVKLHLPGGTTETLVEAQVCAAETVIVGQVPGAYLELPESSG